MQKYKVKNLVFSSSATVYGDVKDIPEAGLNESMPTQPPTNPYGTTKLFIETILHDTQKADASMYTLIQHN
jgi:UDP-glucose 4-epimerase